MPLATIDGLTLGYVMSGSGQPVVMIHGALIADAFQPLFTEPPLAQYQLIGYHRRGYAPSSRSDRVLSVSEQAADCLALMRHLGLQRAHVVGHSFGGAVALQLAIDAPDAVHSLALLEPALILGSIGSEYRESLVQGIHHFHETEASVVVAEMLEARWPDFRAGLARLMPEAFEAAVVDAGAAFEIELPGLLEWSLDEAQVKKMPQPVLSVIGAESGSLSPRFGEVHEWLLATLPNAQGYALPRAHHFLQIENPSDMATMLADFYTR